VHKSEAGNAVTATNQKHHPQKAAIGQLRAGNDLSLHRYTERKNIYYRVYVT